jgi:hypothetical protein
LLDRRSFVQFPALADRSSYELIGKLSARTPPLPISPSSKPLDPANPSHSVDVNQGYPNIDAGS